VKRSALLVVLSACATPPPDPGRAVDVAVERGVRWLVDAQNPDGSWGTGRGTTGFDVMASPPGSHDAFRVGSTALAVMALREGGERTASERGLGYLAAYDGLKRANRAEIYNVWGHTYALQALARAAKETGRDDYRRGAERHLADLVRYETYTGGWNYYDFAAGTQTPSMEGTSFGTAAGLVALAEAKEAGLAVPEVLIRRALARLVETRLPDGTFLYGADYRYLRRLPANKANGSLGRTQSGHDALQLWKAGGIGEREVREGLDRFFREHRFLEIGRKRQYPHEAWYQTSGYYYYFGHFHAARLIAGLKEPGGYPARLRDVILPHQEADGSWWDYKMWDYDKVYGTAFAVMSLLRVRG
jgi:hypothetical protein